MPDESVTTGTEPASRAGRNLPVAAGVGIVLAVLVLVSLYTVKWLFVVVVVTAISIAVYEVAAAVRSAGVVISLVPIVAGSAIMVVAAYRDGADTLAVAYALTMVVVIGTRLLSGRQGLVRDTVVSVFVVTYVALLASFAMLMLAQPDGPDRIVVFILAVVASDTGGYAVGVVAGRHPMAPRVSPKKSWEGLAGSFGLGAVVSAVSFPLVFGAPWWQGALFGCVVVVTATLGDLGESLIKRDLGVKDMGRLLPEHGGLMDRLDSLLPTAPVAAVLLAALV
ncbi:MAG: phosphatidate cytidylyltransferase [Actinomycetes bacterium]